MTRIPIAIASATIYVPGVITPGELLGVHRTYLGGRWTVTHIPTGMQVTTKSTKRDALRYSLELTRQVVGGDFLFPAFSGDPDIAREAFQAVIGDVVGVAA